MEITKFVLYLSKDRSNFNELKKILHNSQNSEGTEKPA